MTNVINSIEALYKVLKDHDEIKSKAFLMLIVRNWLINVIEFDPVSGNALNTGIIDFMNAVLKSLQDESADTEIKDRVYRIVSHVKEAVSEIIKHTRNKIFTGCSIQY